VGESDFNEVMDFHQADQIRGRATAQGTLRSKALARNGAGKGLAVAGAVDEYGSAAGTGPSKATVAYFSYNSKNFAFAPAVELNSSHV
jgi:hypothetical protein